MIPEGTLDLSIIDLKRSNEPDLEALAKRIEDAFLETLWPRRHEGDFQLLEVSLAVTVPCRRGELRSPVPVV